MTRKKVIKPVKFKSPPLNPAKPSVKCPECNETVFQSIERDPGRSEQRRGLVALNTHLVKRHERSPWPGIDVLDD